MRIEAAVAENPGFWALAIGIIVLLCSALMAGRITVGRSLTTPGRLALAGWLPIAITVIVARSLHQTQIAVGVIFGTSVALLSSVAGALSTIAPLGPGPARWRRLWPFTLAASLLAFIIGLHGVISWIGALALLLQGLVVLSLWHDEQIPAGDALVGAVIGDALNRGVLTYHLNSGAGRSGGGWLPRWAEVIMAACLAVAGAYLATHGAARYVLQPTISVDGGMAHPVTGGVLAATLFSLALALPMLRSGRALALIEQSWLPMTSQVGVVLLNLCLLLPLMAFVPYIHWIAPVAFTTPLHFPEMGPRPMVYPLAVWRIDSIALILLSVLLLPVSMGKWNLSREEGLALIAAYFVYLVTVTFAGSA